MKFTLSWLKAHLDTGADVDTISEKLTALGLEVEIQVREPAKGVEHVTEERDRGHDAGQAAPIHVQPELDRGFSGLA